MFFLKYIYLYWSDLLDSIRQAKHLFHLTHLLALAFLDEGVNVRVRVRLQSALLF